MINTFTIEGRVCSIEETQKFSGAIKADIVLEIDTSFFDKKNKREVEKRGNLLCSRYVRPDDDIRVGDYIIAQGKIYITTPKGEDFGTPLHLIESYTIINYET